MKRAISFSFAVVAAASISGAFVLFTAPEARSYISTLVAWHTAANFSALNVVDDTRNIISVDEQRALFNLFGEKFRDSMSIQARHLGRVSDVPHTICGEVNAKNGFGGYVGFVPFVAVLLPGLPGVIEGMVSPEKANDALEVKIFKDEYHWCFASVRE
jgi:hypothetical protein